MSLLTKGEYGNIQLEHIECLKDLLQGLADDGNNAELLNKLLVLESKLNLLLDPPKTKENIQLIKFHPLTLIITAIAGLGFWVTFIYLIFF